MFKFSFPVIFVLVSATNILLFFSIFAMETNLPESCYKTGSDSYAVIFSYLMSAIFSTQCSLADNSDLPKERKSDALRDPEFDFIVVGSGTAGSIVASRLSEVEDWKVLLIERGNDPSTLSKVPGLTFLNQKIEENYNYLVETGGRECHWPRGRGMGGSSIINGMLHMHGPDKDYNIWAEQGNEGWSFEQVLPYFRKSENYHPDVPAKFGKKYFGTGGPMPIRPFNHSYLPMVDDIITSAITEFGFPQLEMFNMDKYIGFGRMYGTLENGVRVNAAQAFLSIAKNRKNLYVLKSTRVDSVIMDGNKAIGVRATLNDGKQVEFKAKKEVILSAGSVASPQILMLSGIGPKEHLKEIGINPLIDLPVGKKLQDHVMLINYYFTYQNENQSLTASMAVVDSLYEFLMKKSGPLTYLNEVDFIGMVNVDDFAAKYPNMEYMFYHISRNNSIEMEIAAVAANMNDRYKREFFKLCEQSDMIAINSFLLQPKSIGYLKLRSSSPNDYPEITPNYFKEKEDMDTFVKGVRLVKKLEETEVFKKHDIKLSSIYIDSCAHTELESDDYWRCYANNFACTGFHPVSTCKMGPTTDPGAVVDTRLKVYGVDGLRVIDASIMPEIVSCHTNSPTMMIAEKGSDMIKEDWNIKN